MKQLPPSDRKSNQNNANYRKSIDISGNIPSIRWVLFIFSVIHVIESIQGCWHLKKNIQNWTKTNIFTISVKIGVKTWYQTPFLASHLAKYRREHSKIRVTSTIKRYISSISPFSVTFHAFFSSYRDDLSRIPALMCELYPVVGGEMSANNKNDVNILTLQAETHNKMRDNAFAITHKTHTRSHLSNYLP